jgi:hypothetical protein
LKDIGLYAGKLDTPENVNWFNKYRDLNRVQKSLQETDTLNYLKGKLVNDLGDEKW